MSLRTTAFEAAASTNSATPARRARATLPHRRRRRNAPPVRGRADGGGGVILVGFNYHRIGGRDPANPYHRLHGVAGGVFRAQIRHALERGPFVSLADAAAGRSTAEVSFFLTFDDAPASVGSVRGWLLDRGIPFHVCPAAGIATDGFGTRDKVNWITARLAPAAIAEAAAAAFGDRAEREDFYRLTKAPDLPPEDVERRLVSPLFARAGSRGFRRKAYLSWEDYRLDYLGQAGVGLVSHGTAHRRMELMDEAALTAEMAGAEAAFSTELGIVPRDFAVPFGEFEPGLARRLDAVAARRGYRSVLWVDRRAALLERGAPRLPLHLPRLHAPETAAGFADRLDRAIAAAGPFGPGA